MAYKIERLEDTQIHPEALVTLKRLGYKSEICWCEHRNLQAPIIKIDKNHYVNKKTGEVKKAKHIKNRSQSKKQVAQSFKRLRDYINYNVVDLDKCKWITLTYKENMTDTKRLMNDYNKFIKRLRYAFPEYEINYIEVSEPQARGAWHCHIILIFDKEAPFIENKVIEEIWGHGFTKTQKIDGNIDDLGAYFSAYLGDLPIEEADAIGYKYTDKDIKKVDDEVNKNSKHYIKGARLSLYPPNFNLYKISRGIKKPSKKVMTYRNAREKIGQNEPIYVRGIKFIDTDTEFTNKIIYEYYNKERDSKSKNKPISSHENTNN